MFFALKEPKKPMAKLLPAVVTIVLGLGFWWAVAEGPLRDPKDTMQDFYEARGRAEDQLIDPLILNGRRVVPHILADLPSEDMPFRRYAIGFLGNGRYRTALPVLEELLADDTEIYYFRADALEAIYHISPERGHELAPAYVEGEDRLSQVATDIVAGRVPVGWTRSYWRAFLHVHE